MSKYYGYHCKTDDDYSDKWINHGDEVLKCLARAWPFLREALKIDTSGYLEVHVMSYGTAPVGWLEEHGGHEIEVSSEYGDVEPIDVAAAPA